MAKSRSRRTAGKKPSLPPPEEPVDAETAEAALPAEAKPPVNEADINWAAVKRLYQNKRRMKVADIASRYGLEERRLREIARERRWLRPDSQPRRPKAPPTIRDRMLVIADGHLTQLEMRMETDAMPDLPESTRQLRDISQMVGGNASKKPDAADGAPQRASGAPNPGEIDAERWRLELVERIQRLKRKLGAT